MTRGASLRSRVKGNFQARFWSSGGRGDSPTDCRKLSVVALGKNPQHLPALTGTRLLHLSLVPQLDNDRKKCNSCTLVLESHDDSQEVPLGTAMRRHAD